MSWNLSNSPRIFVANARIVFVRSSGREIGSRRETAREKSGNAASDDGSGTPGSKMRESSSERSSMMEEDPDAGDGKALDHFL
jgi:hypothetical protein